MAALSEILAVDSNNSFARYGLALEYLSQSNTDAALGEFARVIEGNTDYVPAYQMWGQTLAKLGRMDEAETVLRDGLAAAERVGNGHAASEMQGLLDSLG